jgi:hypothetical protein
MSEVNPQVGQTGAGAQPQQVQVSVREDKATTSYANMTRVTMGPQAEEVIVEMGLMMHDASRQEGLTMDISSRVVMSVYAAKKMALMLSQAIQRYEQQFGPVELDIRKRLKQ